MAAGAMLLKPDVSHLRMSGDYFEPYETYVPLSWDLSDLEEKVDYYLCHHLERTRIAQNASFRLKQDRSFIRQLSQLWKKLGLASQKSSAESKVDADSSADSNPSREQQPFLRNSSTSGNKR
jgi:hypothetical protein